MTIRIGLIGASRVATYAAIDAARAVTGVEVVGVAARSAERARAYAEAHGIAQAFGSYAALIASPAIDLIYIGTPPAAHLDPALASIAAGKHVLVEKPAAMNAGEARIMVDAAAAAGVRLFEAMHSLHHALFRRLRALLDADTIGKVVEADAWFDAAVGTAADEFRWDPGQGGGALMDLGVYPLAWCRFVLGEAFVVESASARWGRGGVDAACEARLRFTDGATARIAAAMDAPAHVARLTLQGERGRITVDNPLAPQRGNRLTVEIAGETASETVDGPPTYVAQITAVRDALTGLTPFPLPSDDPVRSMTAIDRVRAAIGVG